MNNSFAPNSFTNSVSKCNSNHCLTCCSLLPYINYIIINIRKIFLNSDWTCSSSFVIYCLFCTNCNTFYNGKSQTSLSQRVKLHRYGKVLYRVEITLRPPLFIMFHQKSLFHFFFNSVASKSRGLYEGGTM